MDVKINQKEYLKKYLAGDDKTKKKKKKLIKLGPKKVKIIDDDIDLQNLRPMEDGEFDIFNSTEDAPQIAGIIDERGPVDFTDKRRWKIIADDGEGNIAITSNNNHQKNDDHEITSDDRRTEDNSKKSFSKNKERNCSFSDDDQNLRRKSKKLSDNNSTPPRKSSSRHKKSSKKHRRKDSSSSESSSDSSTSSSSSDSTTKRKSKSKKHRSKIEKSKKHDSDLSPPRPSRKHSDNHRESTRHRDADSDLSPPRKSSGNMSRNYKRNRDDDSDLSPPRKSQTNSRDHRHYDSNKNKNLPRRDRERSPRHRKSRWADESRRSQSPQIDKRMKKTLDGKMAGLQDSSSLREEIAAQKKREDDFFYKCSDEMTGVGQATVLRDRKTGRRRNLEAEAIKKREEEKRQEEIVAKYAKWGKGLKQVDDQSEKLQQDLYEMSKPLARYADDKDLDAQLRAVEREGDPMLEYIKQKQIKEGKREPDRPNYQGSFMPNRFGIKPGHRWDGVDRSNGYEKKWFEARNAKTAIQEEAYKWSTSDIILYTFMDIDKSVSFILICKESKCIKGLSGVSNTFHSR
ncbi:hypothetical protein PV327_008216 [Microctonus hyperodae]|uniref:BUD13 homolog n=1 Tax=Microctonus hyperodae TaxID=165561 RepID=A0AA39KH06_MICHY|nr:hypothetical protein PV327_008216 [Microctonus hyperodae]